MITFIQVLHNYVSPEYDQFSTRDRAALDVINEGFFWDRQMIDQEFLERHTPKHGIFSTENLSLKKILDVSLKVFVLFARNNLPMLILNGLLFLVILNIERQGGTNQRLTFFFLFQLVLWGMIVGVAVVFKMPNRLLTPMLVVYTMTHLLYFGLVCNASWFLQRPLVNICMVLLLIGSFVFAYRTYTKINWYQDRCAMNTFKLQTIENQKKYPTVILSRDALSLFNGLNPMRVSPLTRSKTYISAGWFNWYSSFIAQITRACGSPEYIRFFSYLAANRENHVFISTEENNEIQEKYFKELYDRNLIFEKFLNESEFEELTYHYKLNLYKLREQRTTKGQ
jgi:hypothetical protein